MPRMRFIANRALGLYGLHPVEETQTPDGAPDPAPSVPKDG